jgi:hypothetical protein
MTTRWRSRAKTSGGWRDHLKAAGYKAKTINQSGAAAVRAVPYGQDEFLAARRAVASSRDRGRLSQVRGEE